MNTYYATIRERLWPVFLFKVNKTREIGPQIDHHLHRLRDTARRLIKLPASGVPKAFVKHVEDWAKLLQQQANFYEEALRRRAWDQPEPPRSSFMGELIGTLLGHKPSAPKPRPGLAAFQKEALKLSDEAARMESALERLGAELLDGFQPSLYAWFNLWTGQNQEAPTASGMGVTAEQLEGLLTQLPGGKQLSSLDLHRSSEERLTIAGSIAEGFAFQRLDSSGSGYEYSATDDHSLAETLALGTAFLEGDEDWDSAIKWEPDKKS